MDLKGRRVAITVAALGGATILSTVVIGWERIETLWWRMVLTKSPERLVEFLSSPDGSARRLAVQGFVHTSAGKEALLRCFVESAYRTDSGLQNRITNLKDKSHNRWVLFWSEKENCTLWSCYEMPNQTFQVIEMGGGISPDLGRVLDRLEELLMDIGFNRYSSSSIPNLELTLLSKDQMMGRSYEFLQWYYWKSGRVLIITRPGTPFPWTNSR